MARDCRKHTLQRNQGRFGQKATSTASFDHIVGNRAWLGRHLDERRAQCTLKVRRFEAGDHCSRLAPRPLIVGAPAKFVLRPDLLQALDGRLAVHEFGHRPAECLEIFCAAVGFDRGLIGVALHKHIRIGHFTMIELIQQAAPLVFVDLIDELSRDLFELRALAFFDLDRCDNSKH
jgi:hypothetical protein